MTFCCLQVVFLKYIPRIRSESFGIRKFLPLDVQLHQNDSDAQFRRRKYQKTHCEQRYQGVLSTPRTAAPRRPHTVILQSIAEDYAIVLLLPSL